jgi:hypothetical protein
MQAPVIFVTGKPQHGKTTARQILERLTHLKGGSCSDVVYHILAARRGVSPDSLRLLPKEELRPALVQVGDWMCGLGELSEPKTNDKFDDTQLYRHPSALIRTLYVSGYNLIDGVRRRIELQNARDHLDWNGVRSLTLHVVRPNVQEVKDNTEDLGEFADEVVHNDGTVEELEAKLKLILDKHFGRQDEPAAPPAPAEAPPPSS